MAGAGYRTFTAGQILTAAQVQNYLQDQSVMVFDSSAARGSALGTAVSEGMVAYLRDTNSLEMYTGSSWAIVNDNAASIPLSLIQAQGDLIVANGNASVTRLGIGASQGLLYVNGSTPGWLAKGTEGQVLQIVSGNLAWGASASGGMTEITSVSPTGTTTVSFTSIPSTYRNLYITIANAKYTTSNTFSLTVNSTANIYATSTSTGKVDDANLTLISNSHGNTKGIISGYIALKEYAATNTHIKQIESNIDYRDSAASAGNDYSATTRTARARLTSAINAVTITSAGGNWTQGTFTLWGVK